MEFASLERLAGLHYASPWRHNRCGAVEHKHTELNGYQLILPHHYSPGRLYGYFSVKAPPGIALPAIRVSLLRRTPVQYSLQGPRISLSCGHACRTLELVDV